MRKYLLHENYWAQKSTEDTTSSVPNDSHYATACNGWHKKAPPVMIGGASGHERVGRGE